MQYITRYRRDNTFKRTNTLTKINILNMTSFPACLPASTQEFDRTRPEGKQRNINTELNNNNRVIKTREHVIVIIT